MENVDNLEVDKEFNNLFSNRNGLLKLVSKEELLKSYELTHEKNVKAIDFLRDKIRLCKDSLKYNENNVLVKSDLENCEHCLVVLRFNDSLIEEQILNCKKELKK